MAIDLNEETKSPTLEAMEDYWQDKQRKNLWIRNLGASNIGEECEKKIWFTYHYVLMPEFSSRILRLFERGHREEETFIKELKHAGVDVYGEQEAIIGYKGHFVAHPDGRAMGILEAPKTEHLLEFKTMSNKYFNKCVKDGVKKSKPEYYAQMQIQLHMTGITRAFFLAANKDNDEVYGERVYYDQEEGERLMERLKRVIDAPAPLPACDSFACKWCDFRSLCNPEKFDDAKTSPCLNCRTCVCSSREDGGKWSCSVYGEIPKEYQLKGCPKHLLIPGILPHGVVESDGKTFVLYDNGLLNFNDDYKSVHGIETEETLTWGVPF